MCCTWPGSTSSIVQAAATLMPAFGAHAWSVRAMVVVLAVLSLPALVLAWVFEFTPKG